MKTLLLAALLVQGIFVSAQSSNQPAQPASLRLFVAVYERGPAWVEGQPISKQPNVKEHIAYFLALKERLIGAGPVQGGAAETIDGLIMFKAPTVEAARQWLEKDPIIVSRVSTGRILEWMTQSVAPYNR